MNWMSSSRTVRYTAADQLVSLPERPRAPASIVLDTTWRSGGSLRNTFGSLHGAAASAQVSSIGEGARIPSLYEAYVVSVAEGLKLIPRAGLKREKSLVLSNPGWVPLRSATSMRAWLKRPESVSVHAGLSARVSATNTPR